MAVISRCSGHTHRPLLDEMTGADRSESGQLHLPTPGGPQASYALMEYGESGKARFEIRYL